jgi:hypothetical protein
MITAPIVFQEKLAAPKIVGLIAALTGIFCVNGAALQMNGFSWGLVYGILAAVRRSFGTVGCRFGLPGAAVGTGFLSRVSGGDSDSRATDRSRVDTWRDGCGRIAKATQEIAVVNGLIIDNSTDRVEPRLRFAKSKSLCYNAPHAHRTRAMIVCANLLN